MLGCVRGGGEVGVNVLSVQIYILISSSQQSFQIDIMYIFLLLKVSWQVSDNERLTGISVWHHEWLPTASAMSVSLSI